MNRVLIVDDEKNLRRSLATTFELDGWTVETALHGKAALEVLETFDADVVLADLQMPVMDGFELLAALAERPSAPPVVVLTAHGSIDAAVRATRSGAVDFLEKPPHAERVLMSARNAVERRRLSDENADLRRRLADGHRMIGDSPPMRALLETLARAAPTQARVLIRGEHGTGKELVAAAIHAGSPRAGGPFVRLNCAAVPRDLFESELFGHARGAFTGATADRVGRFRRADGGTLFLDEIGELPLELQPKLLRALESGEIEPVGSDEEHVVDVRLIAATNRDLERAVEEGRFRADLFYRIETLTIEVPPLRDRPEDIPALVEHFAAEAAGRHGLPEKRFTPEAFARLAEYTFPGNVRELRNRVERWLILTPGDVVDRDAVEAGLAEGPGAVADADTRGEHTGPLKERVRAFERGVIERTLEEADGNVAEAARRLGLERSHLYKKMRALSVARDD